MVGNIITFSNARIGGIPFFIISDQPTGPRLKELVPQYESEKGAKILEQNRLNGLQMVQFERPR